MNEEQPWMVESRSKIRALKTSDLLSRMAYCVQYSNDPRLDFEAKFVADEIDRRFPVSTEQ